MAKTQGLYRTPKVPHIGGFVWQPPVFGMLILIACSSVATQMLAAAFGYSGSLGHEFIRLGPMVIYAPWAWIAWAIRWGFHADPVTAAVFYRSYLVVGVGAAVTVLLIAVWRRLLVRHLSDGTEDLHGSAHWATKEEIGASGLMGSGRGVYVGAWVDPDSGQTNYLRHDGPEHVIALAPTRAGKGVGLVLPTLLSWPASALVYDIKGENWALTAGWRQSIGQRCLRFEPTAIDGCDRFNPLAEIRIGTDYEVGDVQNITSMIVDPDGRGLNDHWTKTGSALLTGSILHVAYEAKNAGLPAPSLGDVADFLSDPSRSIYDAFKLMLNGIHDPTLTRGWTRGANAEADPIIAPGTLMASPTHPVVAASARDMLNKSETEASGVLSTAMSFLTLYRDPIVRKNTSVSDFRVADLMNADAPASLYLIVPPSDKDRLKPIIRLIINQILRLLTRDMKFAQGESVKAYKHRLLMLIDEFASLGKLDIVQESLAFMAGYGIKAYLIIQDYSQLVAAYTRDEAIFSNCHVRVAYAPNKHETATLLSKMTGMQTILKPSVTISGDPTALGKRNISQTLQEVRRELMTPDEFMRLPSAEKGADEKIVKPGDLVIFVSGMAPIYGRQILYFIDPTFKERAKIEAPTTTGKVVVPMLKSPPPPGLPSTKSVIGELVTRIAFGTEQTQ